MAKKVVVVLTTNKELTFENAEAQGSEHRLEIFRQGQQIAYFDTDDLKRWFVDDSD